MKKLALMLVLIWIGTAVAQPQTTMNEGGEIVFEAVKTDDKHPQKIIINSFDLEKIEKIEKRGGSLTEITVDKYKIVISENGTIKLIVNGWIYSPKTGKDLLLRKLSEQYFPKNIRLISQIGCETYIPIDEFRYLFVNSEMMYDSIIEEEIGEEGDTTIVFLEKDDNRWFFANDETIISFVISEKNKISNLWIRDGGVWYESLSDSTDIDPFIYFTDTNGYEWSFLISEFKILKIDDYFPNENERIFYRKNGGLLFLNTLDEGVIGEMITTDGFGLYNLKLIKSPWVEYLLKIEY